MSPGLFIAGLVLAILVFRFAAGRPPRRRKAQKSGWGAPTEMERDLDAAAILHRLRDVPGLDDRTWSDLDMDAVFLHVDRTSSAVGRQVLYARLRRNRFDVAELLQFDRQVEAMIADRERRETLMSALARLEDDRASYLPYLFLRPLPDRAALSWLYPILTFVALASIAASLLTPIAILPMIAALVTNIGIELHYRRRIYAYVQPLRMLGALLSAGEAVAAAHPSLRDDLIRLRPLRRSTAWLSIDAEGRDDLTTLLIQYINMFFLADVNAFAATLGTIERERSSIERLYEAIGEVDAAISVASFRSGAPVVTGPELLARGADLSIDSAYHPLLRDAVANTLHVSGQGVLVTGSNMSGKSTFLRTLGVNAILAQTIFTTCSRGWRAPVMDVLSSIGRGDDLLAGKSYYLAEVERVGELLRVSDGERQHLFLVDEIFRGTNATERIAASRAVLAHLVRGDDVVVVATHDLELVTLLADRYDPYHFRELVSEGALSFDYRIQTGPSSTRNAIAILRLLGFPDEVVSDAERTVGLLEERSGAGRRLP